MQVIDEKVKVQVIKEEIIDYCYSFCSSCGRVVRAKIIKEEDYVYLIRFCPFEEKKEKQFIGKDWSVDWSVKKYKIPLNWPRLKFKIGQRYTNVTDIINLQEIPFVVFHLTKECNLDCEICFIRDYDFMEEMDLDFIENKLKFFHNQKIILFGGEPTVREDLPQIIKMTVNSGNIPVLFTNGIKLADRFYLKKLIQSGLKHVCLSIDGFDTNIYNYLRKNREGDIVSLKLQALKNLKREKIPVTLQTTIYKGVNEEEIKKLLEYALKNRFIQGLWLRPLYLNSMTNLDKELCLSLEEMGKIVCGYLSIDEDYFNVWDLLKLRFINWLAENFPWVKPSVIELEKIYLIREKDRFSPFISITDLKRLATIFNFKKTEALIKLVQFFLFNPKYLYWLAMLGIYRLRFNKVDKFIYKKGIFEVAIRGLFPVKNSVIIFENGTITELGVFASAETGDGIDVAHRYRTP